MTTQNEKGPVSITLEQIENSIRAVSFVSGEDLYKANAADPLAQLAEEFSLHTTTVCFMVLENGYTILGKSGCADPKKYDRQIGERLAREDCIRQIWPLLGYQLKDQLYRGR
jgi:hypothetical protein